MGIALDRVSLWFFFISLRCLLYILGLKQCVGGYVYLCLDFIISYAMRNFTLKQQQVILVIILCLLILFFLKYTPLRDLSFLTTPKKIEGETSPSSAIEIVGDVQKPGIYCFEHEVNLGEVIERAGGLKRNVVLAQRYFSVEVSHGAKITIGSDPFSFAMEMMAPETRLLYFIPININTASLDELIVVSGIGEKTARAIIRHRQQHGNFSKLGELKEVPGIGHYNFKRMKDYLTI